MAFRYQRRSVAWIANILGVGTDYASLIKQVVENRLSPDAFKAVEQAQRKAYNFLSLTEKKMIALNELIGGYGTVAVFSDRSVVRPAFEYVNTGDTYSPTIVASYADGMYRYTSWGDELEHLERLGYNFQ